MLRAFVAGLQEILGRDLIGIYLLGSVLTREFEPASSDIDFLVVTSRPLARGQTRQIATLHRRLARESLWATRLEGSYAARNRLRAWGIIGRITSVEGKVVRLNAQSDWTAENMMALREDAAALFGFRPAAVFPHVGAPTLKKALRAYLFSLMKGRPRRPEAASETILNIARCLYGMRVQRPCGKLEAASWLGREAPDLRPILTAALNVRGRRARAAERRLLLTGLYQMRKRVRAFDPPGSLEQ